MPMKPIINPITHPKKEDKYDIYDRGRWIHMNNMKDIKSASYYISDAENHIYDNAFNSEEDATNFIKNYRINGKLISSDKIKK